MTNHGFHAPRRRLAPVIGLLGLCLLAILVQRHGRQAQAPASCTAAHAAPVLPPRSASARALWEARRLRTRAFLAVNREREVLDAWDPHSLAEVDPDGWRLQQMAADTNGDLRSARLDALEAAALARTPAEAAGAAELLSLIEHERGDHAAELRDARAVAALEPNQPRALHDLRRAERCFVARCPALGMVAGVGCWVFGVRCSGIRPIRPIRPIGLTRRPNTEHPTLNTQRKPGSPLQLDCATGAPSAPPSNPNAPPADPRLDRKVWIHVTDERIADLLAGLSRATAVTLVPRMEVAEERVSFWADGIPLKEAMRDLRHLHGYYWSRARRHDAYVYSLWQDAQSRAREEAEIQRLALEQQRAFQENVWKHVRALSASEAELKRLGEQDPYLIAQMLHPVVRAGYQFFAALSPDQQAQLLQGQTPSRSLPSGEVLDVSPLTSFSFPSTRHPGQTVFRVPRPESWLAERSPQGDVVTVPWAEMTAAQQAAAEAIVHGAGREQEKEGRIDPHHTGADPDTEAALRNADITTAVVSFFHWGEADTQGLSLQVKFQSGGRPWWLYSNITVTDGAQRFYDDLLRKGEFRVWPGAQDEVDRLVGPRSTATTSTPTAPPAGARSPDPVLDTPVSLWWRLPIREGRPVLFAGEVIDALYRQFGRPMVLDSVCPPFRLPHGSSAEFRWEKRPLRDLLHRLFPRWELSSSEGAIYLRDPDRLKGRIHQVPPTVVQFLQERKGALTLDDAAFLARSLSPWQLVRLSLPADAVDEMLAAQELLRLYGDLAPAQRAMLAEELPFSALTPPQQALFLQFAQRQRPFSEAWRFQQGALRLMAQQPPPAPADWDNSPHPVARSVFQVSLQPGDVQSFPIDQFPPRDRTGWPSPRDWVGKPFPFPLLMTPERQTENPTWKPVLADPALQGRAAVFLLAHPFARPFISAQPPTSRAAWVQDLASRLRGAGILVVDVRLGAAQIAPGPSKSSRPAAHPSDEQPSSPRVVHFQEDGDEMGQPFDSTGFGIHIDQSPTAVVIGRDEIVRAVFEGDEAWDTAAIATAARRAIIANAPSGARLPAHSGSAP